MRHLFLTAAMVGTMALAGCSNNSTGTHGSGVSRVDYDVYPTEILVLKPGESKDVKVTHKGQGKANDLTLTSSDPKVKVEGGKFAGGGKEATVTIKADPDAPNKEHTITIKAGDVTKTVKVKVDSTGGDAHGGSTGGTAGGSSTTPTASRTTPSHR